ncbi:MAG: NADP-dependent oxidoreductase, partial [Sphingomonadales bacterium]
MSKRQCWRLVRRPDGEISDDDLSFAAEDIPSLSDGDILVEVEYISVDATNRIWMSDADQYMPPVEIGDIMRAGVAGKVIASQHPNFTEGMSVGGLGGYASHIVASGDLFGPIPEVPSIALPTLFGSLGGTALTAYFGLLKIGEPKPGETLVVSAAAGAVGSMVGQIGK